MTGTITIRPALASDHAALADLHARCFERGWPADELKSLAGTPGVSLWLAEDDAEVGPPTGFLLMRQVADEAEILTLAVDPAHRRRGIALALINAALDALEAHGVVGVFLEVAADNAPAIALYEGLGFERVGMRRDYYGRADGPRVDGLALRLIL